MTKRKTGRQIVGFSLPIEIARAVKTEAERRKIKLRKLFEEMWADYQKKPMSERPPRDASKL